jgi:hypothetical protein
MTNLDVKCRTGRPRKGSLYGSKTNGASHASEGERQ